MRLVRALAVETNENWMEANRYINMDDPREHKKLEKPHGQLHDRPILLNSTHTTLRLRRNHINGAFPLFAFNPFSVRSKKE